MKKPIWTRRNPKRSHTKMTVTQRARARRAARRRGRRNPSLVDNINAMRD